MSKSLLKKSLELAETDFVAKKYKAIKGKEREKVIYSELKYKKNPKKDKQTRGVADVKKSNINCVDKIRREIKIKKKGVNRKKLNLLHKTPNKNLVNKLLEHLGYGNSKDKSEEEQTTAFTEEDFIKFEKEYFHND